MIHGIAERAFVEEQAVLLLAVLAQALAVVGDDRDERAIEAAACARAPSISRPMQRVDVGNLAVVGRRREARVERRRRSYGACAS